MDVADESFASVDESVYLRSGGSCAWEDLNGDSRPDLVCLSVRLPTPTSTVYMLASNQSLDLVPVNETGLSDRSEPSFAITSVGGSKLAMAVTSTFADRDLKFEVYDSLGNGSWQPRALLGLTNQPRMSGRRLVVHDIDNDGNNDVLWTGTFDGMSVKGTLVLFFGTSGDVELTVNVSSAVYRGLAAYSSPDSGVGQRSTMVLMLAPVNQVPSEDVNLAKVFQGRTPNNPTTSTMPSVEATADYPWSMLALDDFDGDGCDDMFFCGQVDAADELTALCFLMNSTCDGSFRFASFKDPLPAAGASLQSGDFDGDGRADVLYVTRPFPNFPPPFGDTTGTRLDFPSHNALYLTSGDFAGVSSSKFSTSFASAMADLAGIAASTWVVVDFDVDGVLDVVAAVGIDNFASSPFGFMRGLGNGSFEYDDNLVIVYGLSVNPFYFNEPPQIVFANFSGAQMPDLFVSAPKNPPASLGGVFVRWNSTFLRYDMVQSFFSPLATSTGRTIAAADFDANGFDDLFLQRAAGPGGEEWSAAYSNGTRMQYADDAVLKTVREFSLSLAAADMDDGAGGMDLLATYETQAGIIRLRLFYGQTNASFLEAPQTTFPPRAGASYGAIKVGDIDADGEPEIVLLGLSAVGCIPPQIYDRPEPSLSSSTTGGDSGGDGDGSTAGAVAGAVGGTGALLLALIVACGCVAICCLICVLLALAACVVAVVALFVLMVVVAGVALVGVAGVGGGVAALIAVRRRGEDEAWFDEPAETMEEVTARMQATKGVRQLEWSSLTFGRVIGSGAYGKVYEGEWQAARVAIKVVQATGRSVVDELRSEALVMAKVSHHPHVVTFIGMSTQGAKAALVLGYCERGSLDALLKARALTVADKKRVLGEVAGALAFLHSMSVVHRDVAARNVLVAESGAAMLSDLGLSRVLSADQDEQSTKSNVGPVRWMAPESLASRTYSPATDAWAFGVLMWEVWADGEVPYADLKSVADVATAVVRSNRRLTPPPSCPPLHAETMASLFQPTRPSLDQVCSKLLSEGPDTSPNQQLLLQSSNVYVDADDLQSLTL